ncbi:MAG: hypothetical protein JWP06_1167 [Candidatus Saccharibacteria bacterium]|nr:hypothetical protein [Candidatus Saccharibacteria bacterium]
MPCLNSTHLPRLPASSAWPDPLSAAGYKQSPSLQAHEGAGRKARSSRSTPEHTSGQAIHSDADTP